MRLTKSTRAFQNAEVGKDKILKLAIQNKTGGKKRALFQLKRHNVYLCKFQHAGCA